MKFNLKAGLLAGLLVVGLVFGVMLVSADTIIVEETESIQEVINEEATAGDTILIEPGTYVESSANSWTSWGLTIDKKNLSIVGLNSSGNRVTDSEDVEVTIKSANQSGWGTNHWVTASGVSISGVELQPEDQNSTNKTLEVDASKFGEDSEGNFTITDSKVVGGSGSSIYLNSPGLNAYKISSNEISGEYAVSINNGVGQDPGNEDEIVSNNSVSDSGTFLNLDGEYNLPWQNYPVGFPKVSNNNVSNVDRYLSGYDLDTENLANKAYVQNFSEDNGLTNFTYVLNEDGTQYYNHIEKNVPDPPDGDYPWNYWEYNIVEVNSSIQASIDNAETKSKTYTWNWKDGEYELTDSATPAGTPSVIVGPGIYEEDVEMKGSISLKGLSGTGYTKPTLNGTLNLGDLENSTISNLTIKNDGYLMDSGYGTTTFKNVKFEDMEFIDTDDSGRAIYFGYDHSVAIEGETGLQFVNSLFDAYMILGSNSTGGPLVFNNVTNRSGINTYGGIDVTVKNSSTEDGGWFYLSGIEDLTVEDNVFTADVSVNGANGATVVSNDFKNNTGIYPSLPVTAAWGPTQNHDVTVTNNNFSNITTDAIAIYAYTNSKPDNDFLEAHYNSFSNVKGYAVFNQYPEYTTADASLNYWGGKGGPASTGGDNSVSDGVIYSPWLADSLDTDTGIDTDPNTPGIQLPETVNIIVDDVGPAPTTEDGNTGYLNQAIWGSNQLTGRDIINVLGGDFDASEEITDSVVLQGVDSDAVVGAEKAGSAIHVTADNTTIRNLKITSTGNSGEVEGIMVGDFEGFTDQPGEVIVENNLIDGINTTSDTAVEGIHAKFYDDGGDQIDGLTIRNNRITDVSEPDSGADGVKLQANLNNVSVTGNTIENIAGAWSYGVVTTPSNLEGGVPKNVTVARNVFENITANTYSSVAVGIDTESGGFGSYTSGSEVTVRYNDLSGADYGVLNKDTDDKDDVDATLNYWGHPTGPYHPAKNSKGKGNKVSDNVIFSPWLRVNPDADPNKPGVQLGPPMKFGVDDKGPAPVAGYLDKAIGATNQIPGSTIVVNHGTYSPDKQVTQSVEIVSVKGSPANTHINGNNLNIAASNVRIGRREGYTSRGFTVRSNITIDSGVDASKVHINWNNLLGDVTNNGDNTLDAEYNWWGDDNPDDSTFGDVDYNPYLTAPVGEVMDYMEENGIEDPVDAAAGIVMEQASASERAVSRLTGMGFSPGEAEGLIGQYGLGRVMNAMEGATAGRKFTQLLGGYSLPAGAGGGLTNNLVAGGAGSVGGRTVGAVFTKGQSIEVSFPLADFQGNPAKDLTPTVSLVLLNEDGEKKSLEKVTTADYDDESSAYVAVFETTKLQPGYYEVQIDLPDGSSLSQVIKVEGAEA